MVSVPLGASNWIRTRGQEPQINLINRFFEENPTNRQEQTSLLVRPALSRRIQVGAGPIRAMYSQTGFATDDLFAVSDDELWRIHAEFGELDTATQITGTIAGDDQPEMVARDDYLFIADGSTLQYTDGTTALATIATPDSVAIRSVDTIGSYILCTVNNTQRVYWINPFEVTIDPLNFFEAEKAPDPLQNVRVIGDQIWLLGKSTSEVWYLSGASVDLPFSRVQGRLFDKGAWQGTAVAVRDRIILVGNDGIVYDVTGQPTPISNPGVEQLVREAMRLQED